MVWYNNNMDEKEESDFISTGESEIVPIEQHRDKEGKLIIDSFELSAVERSRQVRREEARRKIAEITEAGGDITRYIRGRVLEELGGIEYLVGLIKNNDDNVKVIAKVLDLFLSGHKPETGGGNNTQVNIDVGNALNNMFNDVVNKGNGK